MKEKDLASEIITKLVRIIILLIVVLLATNGMWIWYINQYDFVSEELNQEVNNNDKSIITQNGVSR